jgi:hypothetical protein
MPQVAKFLIAPTSDRHFQLSFVGCIIHPSLDSCKESPKAQVRASAIVEVYSLISADFSMAQIAQSA